MAVHLGKPRAAALFSTGPLLRVRGELERIARYARRDCERCGGTGLVPVERVTEQCGCAPWLLHLRDASA